MNTQTIINAIDQAIATGAVEGASIRVLRDGEQFVHAQGTASGAQITEESAWWLASITKSVVSVAVLQCVEQGAFLLDDPVEKYVPSWSQPRQVRKIAPGTDLVQTPPFATEDPNQWVLAELGTPVTLRHLITGTSGLQTIGIPNLAIRPITLDDTLETYVDSLATPPLDFQPGERWHYSNFTAFDVAARVVEVASSMTFANFVRSQILDPLVMDHTDFGLTARNKSVALPLLPMVENHPMMQGFASGSAGLVGTAADVERFSRMLVGGGQLDGVRVLESASVAEMTRNQIGELRLAGIDPTQYGGLPAETNPGIGYGYGVAVVIDSTTASVPIPNGSFGWDGIGSRRWWSIPRNDTVITMMVEGTAAADLHREIEAAVLD